MTNIQAHSVAGRDVSRETFDRFKRFAALLNKWNSTVNLVAPSTLPDVWTRHIEDSAQLFFLAPPAPRVWADIGSGGGLPGIVVAILAAEFSPGTTVVLVESDKRKAAFLNTVRRDLKLDLQVKTERIEELAPLEADVLSARALAPLPDLLAFAERHAPHGVCLFSKGASFREELQTALENWSFDCEDFPSITDPAGVILRIGGIARG